nr:hypothetical protein [uncultured Cupriavidus sp.]
MSMTIAILPVDVQLKATEKRAVPGGSAFYRSAAMVLSGSSGQILAVIKLPKLDRCRVRSENYHWREKMYRRSFLIGALAFGVANLPRAEAGGSHRHADGNSRLTLLYLGQVNCPSCRGYEAEYFGRMDKMMKSFPEFGEVDYLKLSMGAGRGAVFAWQLPEHLKWLADDGPGGKRILRNRGTPYFAAIVDREVWAQGPSVAALEGEVIPALRRAVLEKHMSA